MQDLPFKKLFESLQFGIGDIRNGRVIAVGISPMEEVVTLARDGLLRRASARRYWPYEQIYWNAAYLRSGPSLSRSR